MIYDEVKKVNNRLQHIENVIEDVIVKNLPEVTLSQEKFKEIESSVKEMKQGECLTLEELKRA